MCLSLLLQGYIIPQRDSTKFASLDKNELEKYFDLAKKSVEKYYQLAMPGKNSMEFDNDKMMNTKSLSVIPTTELVNEFLSSKFKYETYRMNEFGYKKTILMVITIL